MYIIISIIMNQNPVAGENQAPLSTYGDFKIWPASFIYTYIYINTYICFVYNMYHSPSKNGSKYEILCVNWCWISSSKGRNPLMQDHPS